MVGRLDGALKVTGRARYGADHNLPGMAYGYVLLSTIAHGEVAAMDVTAAKSSPGVLGIYSPFDPLELRTPATFLGETWDYVVAPAESDLRLKVAALPFQIFEVGEDVWLEFDPRQMAPVLG